MTALAQHDQSAAGEVEPARPGRTEFGMIRVDDRVVARLAAQAALEISDAGCGGALGIRQTSLSALPKAHAEVDGSIGRVKLSISVSWTASVPAVADAVR